MKVKFLAEIGGKLTTCIYFLVGGTMQNFRMKRRLRCISLHRILFGHSVYVEQCLQTTPINIYRPNIVERPFTIASFQQVK